MKKIILISLTGIITTLHAFAQTGCISGDCQNGNGTYKWENGDTYTGQWQNNARTGYGRYDWSNGSYYVGNFQNNLLNGQGAYFMTDGTSMTGWFVNNNYAGTEKPADSDNSENTVNNTDNTDGTDSLAILLQQMADDNAAYQQAKTEAIENARKEDLCSVLKEAVNDFENKFKNLEGKAIPQTIGDNFFSNVMIQGSTEAEVTNDIFSNSTSWSNTLDTSEDFNTAKAHYDNYVNIISECHLNCCTMVYDTMSYKGEDYSDFDTYWLTFLVRDGFDDDTYKDLYIQVELKKAMLNDGWDVSLEVGDVPDK